MHQHRRVEPARREQRGDVREMTADGLAAAGVVGVVRRDVDGAAVLIETEVVARPRLVEAHHLRAAGIDRGVVRVVRQSAVLGCDRGERAEGEDGGQCGALHVGGLLRPVDRDYSLERFQGQRSGGRAGRPARSDRKVIE